MAQGWKGQPRRWPPGRTGLRSIPSRVSPAWRSVTATPGSVAVERHQIAGRREARERLGVRRPSPRINDPKVKPSTTAAILLG